MAAEQTPGYRHPAFVRPVKKPRVPVERTCLGHETDDGHVACTTSLRGMPSNQKRCLRCALANESLKRNRADKKRRARRAEPRTCIGHDSETGHIACAVDMTRSSRKRKRCMACSHAQRRHTSTAYWHKHGPKAEARRSVSGVNIRSQLGERPHVPTKHCEECCGLSERRPLTGLCKCGLPWMAEQIDRVTVLHSSMGRTVDHKM